MNGQWCRLRPRPSTRAGLSRDALPRTITISRLLLGGLPALTVVTWLAAGGLLPARASTPESPEVQQAVTRAVKYLENDVPDDQRVGALALRGLALLKHGAAPDHARVKQAVERIRGVLGEMDPAQVKLDIYSTGISTIFLIELDPEEYASEIQCLLDSLVHRQKPHGGWGYPDRETGDTSMTQYGALSAWEGTQRGFRFPIERVELVATWLLKTQDPSGGFGYQGNVSATFAPVPQTQIKLSLTAAGLGSLYICADLLGVGFEIRERDPDLPPALKVVEEDDPAGQKDAKTRLDSRLFHAAETRGQSWMRHNYKIDPPDWTHYYLYALERYMSFRELAELEATGRAPEKSPRWYNDGVAYLLKMQADDGSWKSRGGPMPDTAFGILFLLRSQKKSIEKARSFGAGSLVGGRGLPKVTAGAEVRGGQVVARPLLGPAEELLAKLDDPDSADYDEAVALLAEIPPEELATLAGEQAAKLRRLAEGRSAEARLAAVQAMGRSGSLDHVPTLIYALTDPDPQVVRAAHDALRRISRKPPGFGMPDEASEPDRRRAVEQWQAWYRTIRPDAKFE
jgi:hypothetical protein